MQKVEPMSDWIDRLSATSIPVMPKEHRNYRTYNLDDAYEDGWNDALASVNELPSAQPEIIRCRDCKYGSPNGRYGCRVYHYQKYETHDMKPDDFCSYAERRTDE